jgi:hypothetical protein
VSFAERGDFEGQHRSVEVRGFIEASLAVAEAGELRAEVDDLWLNKQLKSTIKIEKR